MALYHDLIEAAEACPEAIALEFKAQKMTYRALRDQSLLVAAALQNRGFDQRARVGLMLPNCPQYISIAYGVFMCGGVVTPLNVLLKPREVAHILRDSAIDVLFITAALLPVIEVTLSHLDHRPEIIVLDVIDGKNINFLDFIGHDLTATCAVIPPDQHMLTLYTSGTTGPSKGVMISDRNLRAQVGMLGQTFDLKEGTRLLCVLPLFHAYGLNAIVNTAIHHRATVVLHERFNAEACAKSLATDAIQWFAGVPTMYGMLLEYGRQHPELVFPDLEVCLTGGAAMNADVLADFEARYETAIYEGYGLTETTVSVASNATPPETRKLGSVGRPYPGVESRVVDETGTPLAVGDVGELTFKGDNLMLGYLNLPEETTEVLKAGWLHSGDLGYIDEDGFCFIVGRKKDLIIKSGYNIVPLEIEEVLRQAELVRDAAVVGIPDQVRGERILAAVVLQDPAKEEEARRQIAAIVTSQLAKYKHPNEILIVEQFPLGPSGKILKKDIRDTWIKQSKTQRVEEHVHATA